MNAQPYIAEAAQLIGDPARANMLLALIDGRALTATELAITASVTPQTASAHLAKLAAGRLLAVEKQGRHRYFRLASGDVARAVEALMALAAKGPPRYRPPGPRDHDMRIARTCYDHLAGRLGVALVGALTQNAWLKAAGDNYQVTRKGTTFFAEFGIDLAQAQAARRAFARPCLDWSERVPHLAGALGAALAERCFSLGWLNRQRDGRALIVTDSGRRELKRRFGLAYPFEA